MTPFALNIEKVAIRFFLMMGVIIAAGFTGIWLLALLGLPIFLTGLLGVGKENKEKKNIQKAEAVKLNTNNPQKAA